MIHICLCCIGSLSILVNGWNGIADAARVSLQQQQGNAARAYQKLELDGNSTTDRSLLATFDLSFIPHTLKTPKAIVGTTIFFASVLFVVIAGSAFYSFSRGSNPMTMDTTALEPVAKGKMFSMSEATLDGFHSKNITSRSISWWHWLFITAFQFIYSTLIVLMSTLILPSEAERMHKDNKGFWVSVYILVSGSTQIFCPIIGKLSDRHSSRYGKRRPFMVVGMLMSAMSLFALWRASITSSSQSYLVSLFLSMFFLNMIFSAQSGLPADLQGKGSEDTSGTASGLIALHSFLGALTAMALVSTGLDVQVLYPIGLLGVVIVSSLVCIVTPEAPSNHVDPLPFPTRAELLQSFMIDLKHDLDFFWVCLGRLFFYINTAFVVYIYYYLRDMMHIQSESQRRQKLVTVILIAQVLGAIVSVVSSRLSSQIGRKPVIHASSVLMCITHLLYIIAPKIGPEGSWSAVVVACLFYGVGCGCYLSVDYAIALDCLPSGKSSAEALGVWGVVGFFGSTLGPAISGLLLMISSKPGPAGEQFGYVSYATGGLVLGVLMAVLLSIVTMRIKSVA